MSEFTLDFGGFRSVLALVFYMPFDKVILDIVIVDTRSDYIYECHESIVY